MSGVSGIKVHPIDKPIDMTIDTIPADKSISHRVAIFAMLCEGTCTIENYLLGEDTLHTLSIMESLGATVVRDDARVVITPPEEIQEPDNILECGNSGTAIRLIAGYLAGQSDKLFILTGDASIRKRPMKRIIAPLNDNGADIISRADNTLAPIVIKGRVGQGFAYETPVPSAQIKSALMLYALFAKTPSTISEASLSRDHSEILLKKLGADIKATNQDSGQGDNGQKIVVNPLTKKLEAFDIVVPNDPSSAFFFALMATIIKGSRVRLKRVLLNKTRIEAFKVLEQMGANISFHNVNETFETIGDIEVAYAPLRAVEVSENIAWLIDEIPALSIAFCFAKGVSTLKNAKELRFKESDRIKAIVDNLKLFGVEVSEFDDGFSIKGKCEGKWYDGEKLTPKAVSINSFGDHRIAMSFAILGIFLGVKIEETDCIKTSFPNFVSILQTITTIETS